MCFLFDFNDHIQTRSYSEYAETSFIDEQTDKRNERNCFISRIGDS